MTKNLAKALHVLSELLEEESFALEKGLAPVYAVFLGEGGAPENAQKAILEARVLDMDLDSISEQIKIEESKEGELDKTWLIRAKKAAWAKSSRLGQIMSWATASVYVIRRQRGGGKSASSFVPSTKVNHRLKVLEDQVQSLKIALAKINKQVSQRPEPESLEDRVLKKLERESIKRRRLSEEVRYIASVAEIPLNILWEGKLSANNEQRQCQSTLSNPKARSHK